MVRDVYKLLIPLLVLVVLFVLLKFSYLAVLALLLALFVAFFFRNPDRSIPKGEKRIVSPGDGKIVKISESDNGESTISIFLSIFDVHVNRSPISGTLESLEYKRGRFKAAFLEEASRVNEQNILVINGEEIRVVVRQIAGVIARRVVCWKKPGDVLQKGERIGMIRFGSRMDIVLPAKVRILVKLGDRVHGGTSVLGEYP